MTGPIRIGDLQSEETSDDSVQKSGCDTTSTSTTSSSPNICRSKLIIATTSYNYRDNAITTSVYTQSAHTNKVRTAQVRFGWHMSIMK